MRIGGYIYKASETFLDYEFYSEGPKGLIKKVIEFQRFQEDELSYYNLSFGDWNEEAQSMDDLIISNNGDDEKILITVANTIIEFTNQYPGTIIYVEGSTLSRTRKYQMGINKYWHRIEPFFELRGLAENGEYQPFAKGNNYKAFLIKRK